MAPPAPVRSGTGCGSSSSPIVAGDRLLLRTDPRRGDLPSRVRLVTSAGAGSRNAVLAVLGELVVDLLPGPSAGGGPEGTGPRYVARPGGDGLNLAVARRRLGTAVPLPGRGTGEGPGGEGGG